MQRVAGTGTVPNILLVIKHNVLPKLIIVCFVYCLQLEGDKSSKIFMHIKEVIIDGFKSYSERTVIQDWDEQFNCITGLNGSGKSNILDAICFVLGITSMVTVRVRNQQDLIYKRGQAGITRASVSIIFDNTDELNSPQELKNTPVITITRQIVMGGASKYLVNGHRAQQSQVQSLFREVHLNVNNPNFLIMQGQITKVVNMRPTEILGLIEEAASTSIYKLARIDSIKQLEKLDVPFKNTEKMIVEEIRPKLMDLHAEKRAYYELQIASENVSKLEKVIASSDYTRLCREEVALKSEIDINEIQRNNLVEVAQELDREVKKLQASIDEIVKTSPQNSSMINGLEQEIQQLMAEYSDVTTEADANIEQLRNLTEQKQLFESTTTDLKSKMAPYEEQVNSFDQNCARVQQLIDESTSSIDQKREILESLQLGISSQGETGFALAAKQAGEKERANSTKLTQLLSEKEHLSEQIKERAGQCSNFSEVENMISVLQEEIETKQTALIQVQQKFDQYQQYSERRNQLQNEHQTLNSRIGQIQSQHPGLAFPKFDGVIGPVATCFTVPQEHGNKLQALEVCAGGAMWSLVVENEKVGSTVIKSARKRVNVLPLNRMHSNIVSADRVRQIDPENNNAWLALDLLEFDARLKPALAHVFGQTVICATPSLAEKAAYKLGLKAITLTGDVYDPRGIISGGSRNNRKGSKDAIFIASQEFQTVSFQISRISQELSEVNASISELGSAKDDYQRVSDEVSVHKHKLEIKIRDMDQLRSIKDELDALQAKLVNITENEIPKTEQSIEAAQMEGAKAMKDMQEMATNRKGKLAELQAQFDEENKNLANLQAQLDVGRDKYTQSKSELSSLAADFSSAQRGLDQVCKDLEDQLQQKEEFKAQSTRLQSELNEKQKVLLNEKSKIAAQSEELQISEKKLDSTRAELAKCTFEIPAIESDLNTKKDVYKKVEEKKEALRLSHAYVEEASPTDVLTGAELEKARRKFEKEKEKLKMYSGDKQNSGSHIIKRVQQLEARETELLDEIRTIKEDKLKLTESMQILDQKRIETIEQVWQKVSADLGAIFSSLLPRASAELMPVGNFLEEGFQIRVKLGNTWKEGLTELSGGQRSLVALSLILALLQYHPAPIYILDEVDAALDAHHTKNIGHIIKTRFKTAQFIVVSLKDDMFTNANKIFQTQFVEGKSTVSVLSSKR